MSEARRMAEVEDQHAEATARLRSRLAMNGALDDSIAERAAIVGLRERIEAAIAYIEASVTARADKNLRKWDKGYHQAQLDTLAVLRLVTEGDAE